MFWGVVSFSDNVALLSIFHRQSLLSRTFPIHYPAIVMNKSVSSKSNPGSGRRIVSSLSISVTLLMFFAASTAVNAQKFDFEGYLKKLDANRNGKLDVSEMSDRTRGWMRKMGFDTEKPVSISKILAKAKKDKRDADNDRAKKAREASRKVPGFGGSDRTTTGVSRFTGGDAKSSSGSKEKFSESVMERVSSTLDRYDKNKDGVLDRGEVKNARWGSPSPEESDKNKDGRLSRDELAARYAARERYYKDRESGDSRRRSSSKSREEEDRARRARDRERFRNSGSSSSSRRSSSSTSSRPSSSRSTTSSSSKSSSAAKYKKYAESLISNYDKDKDGKLSKEEIKQMRRPPVGADTDSDGYITQSELLASLSGDNKKSSSSSSSSKDSKSSSKSNKYVRKESSSKRSSGSRRSGGSSSFERLDSNADKRVQMHEFSEDWDEKKIEEFYAKDKNGDGVITLREWSER